jgi:DNA-binding IclR family transcriptional regulator
LLSGLPDPQIEQLAGPPLRSYTSSTISTVKGLLAAVAVVRRSGHAVAVDEYEVGLTAVAAPVRDAADEVVASVSVSGSTLRLDSERVDTVVAATMRTAAAISARLGWHAEVTTRSRP